MWNILWCWQHCTSLLFLIKSPSPNVFASICTLWKLAITMQIHTLIIKNLECKNFLKCSPWCAPSKLDPSPTFASESPLCEGFSRSTLRWWLKCETSWWIATLHNDQRPNLVQLGKCFKGNLPTVFLVVSPRNLLITIMSPYFVAHFLPAHFSLQQFKLKLVMKSSTLQIYSKNLQTCRPFGWVTIVWRLLHSISMVSCTQ